MWFADIGEVIAGGLALAWVGAATFLLLRCPPRILRLRPVLLGGTSAAVLLFDAQAGLVDTVADHGSPLLLDTGTWSWFVSHRAGWSTTLMIGVSDIGGTVGEVALTAVCAGVLWWRHRRAEAALAAVATVGAGLLVVGFKNLYQRARPPIPQQLVLETNASLPSGHSLGSVVVVGTVVAVVALSSRRVNRLAAAGCAAAAVVAIGTSRLYLGVHWLTDVLTGWLLGGAWLALCVTALMVLRGRSRPTLVGSGGQPTGSGSSAMPRLRRADRLVTGTARCGEDPSR